MTIESADPTTTDPSGASTTRMSAVVCLDLADSTALVERLGDARAADLIRQHDRMARDLMQRHHGREIDKTDGFLVLFERAIDAVAFALEHQLALARSGRDGERLLRARIGIHVGEVVLWENSDDDVARGAKPLEVEGLAKPLAARLTSLARPGQVLLSEHAYGLSRRAEGELPTDLGAVRWLDHGRYRFKGIAEAMPVYEAGLVGSSPLRAPISGPKAERERPLWRHPTTLAIEIAALILIASGVFYLLLRDSPALAFAERDWVVVGDLINHTTEPLFDDALETALRVGLEQSRFINLIPELQVNASLARMNAGTADIDRRIGTELAVREGARAVFLPTIAEVGGRVRFTVEVIDPRSGATVFGESADSDGLDGVLPAMDDVVARLRTRLGESMASISASSAPLARVTTGNLEALKAYSLAIDAMATGDPRKALMLFNRAIELDPDFSAAHAKLAGLHLLGDDRQKSRAALEAAYRNRERLSERERLHMDGMMANLHSPDAMIERWGQLAALYPDYLVGQQNLGSAYWMQEYRYAAALEQFNHLIDSGHPLRTLSMQNAAVMYTALGEFDQASELYARALSHGGINLFDGPVDLHLAQRQHEQALATLSVDLSRDIASTVFWKALRKIAVQADLGQARAVEQTLAELAQNPAVSANPANALRMELARLAVLADTRPDAVGAELETYLDRLHGELDPNPLTPIDGLPSLMLIAANLAAQTGHLQLADRHYRILAPRVLATPTFERLALLDALRWRLKPSQPDLDEASLPGNTFYLDRSLYLREIARAEYDLAQDQPDALDRLASLCRDRRTAVSEWGSGFSLLVPNILASNRACQRASQVAEHTGRTDLAKALGELLDRAWQHADPDWPGRRTAGATPADRSLDQEDPEA